MSMHTVFGGEEEERRGQEALRPAEAGNAALPCVGLVGDRGWTRRGRPDGGAPWPQPCGGLTLRSAARGRCWRVLAGV